MLRIKKWQIPFVFMVLFSWHTVCICRDSPAGDAGWYGSRDQSRRTAGCTGGHWCTGKYQCYLQRNEVCSNIIECIGNKRIDRTFEMKSEKCGEACYVKHCMTVCIASKTQKIQSFDWPKWHYALWCCINSHLLLNPTSFLIVWQNACQ